MYLKDYTSNQIFLQKKKPVVYWLGIIQIVELSNIFTAC